MEESEELVEGVFAVTQNLSTKVAELHPVHVLFTLVRRDWQLQMAQYTTDILNLPLVALRHVFCHLMPLDAVNCIKVCKGA